MEYSVGVARLKGRSCYYLRIKSDMPAVVSNTVQWVDEWAGNTVVHEAIIGSKIKTEITGDKYYV